MIPVQLYQKKRWYQRDLFITTEDVSFKLSNNTDFLVTKGTITDFASVPFPILLVLPVKGNVERAVLLRDELYNRQYYITGYLYLDRKFADLEFLRLMKEQKVKARYLYYWGVRLGGLSWWVN